MHLDVDLYNSYKNCLDFFYPLLVNGGIITFDEYDNTKWTGAKVAIDEFLKKRQQKLLETSTGFKYLIKN